MKILYITELWSGLEDLIIDGGKIASGMPSFLKPLEYMIHDKNVEIDIVIIGKEPRTLNIQVDWLKNASIFWVNNRSFLKMFSIIRIIRKGNYDFIYGQGEGGAWGNIPAILTRKPFGMRYYGTFLSRHLDENWFRFIFRNPLATLSYNLPKKFLLTTNDGTKGDKVHEKLCVCKRLYKFKYWLNGVNKVSNLLFSEDDIRGFLEKQKINKDTYLLVYPARYDPWKRQHKAIEILEELPVAIKSNIKLLFCGHVYDKSYFDELKTIAYLKGLSDNIILENVIPNNLLQIILKRSFVVLSFYELSNLGNALIEAAINGCAIMTINDGSTSFLIEHGKSGFLLNDDSFFSNKGKEILVSLINDEQYHQMIKTNIKEISDISFSTWEERCENEYNLILSYVRKP